MPSQLGKHSLKTIDQIGHASLMEKAGFNLKTPAAEKVYLQKWNIVLFRGPLRKKNRRKELFNNTLNKLLQQSKSQHYYSPLVSKGISTIVSRIDLLVHWSLSVQ